jgi:hypothetical protein
MRSYLCQGLQLRLRGGEQANRQGATRHATSHWGVPVRGERAGPGRLNPFPQRAAAVGGGRPAGRSPTPTTSTRMCRYMLRDAEKIGFDKEHIIASPIYMPAEFPHA